VLYFVYITGGLLKVVSDNFGYALVFDYNASNVISAACGFNMTQTTVTSATACSGAALKTAYAYAAVAGGPTGQNRVHGPAMVGFTDVGGQATSYGRNGAEISCVQPPGYATCKIANVYFSVVAAHESQKVHTQTLGDGTVWTYSASPTSTGNSCVDGTRDDACVEDDGARGTSISDPLGNVRSINFTKSSPYSYYDGLGRMSQYRFTGV
jgi:hypothetical protein